jgi:hypothetical protein
MFDGRTTDRFLDTQEGANHLNLTEWNAGLGHSPWAGVHAQQQGADSRSRIPSDVRAVWLPGVLEWVVDHVDWIAKLKSAHGLGELAGDPFDGGDHLCR